MNKWLPVETAPKDRRVVVFWKNELQKGRTSFAINPSKFSIESSEEHSYHCGEVECEHCDWNPETEVSYVPEGQWLEYPYESEELFEINQKILFWMYPPQPPEEE